MSMKKVALKVAYIGTNFHGFQRQPDQRTVEDELIYTLKKLGYINDLKKAYFGIAGRTDSGVHAMGNAISFMTEKEILINHINDYLPDDVKILAKAKVPYGFKPRYAKQRHYKYIISENVLSYPLNWNLKVPKNGFDLDKMIKAAEYFKGEHNFINFSKRCERNPIRTVDNIHVEKKGHIISIDVLGESFLWNMVRKMVKPILEVGNGKLEPEIILEMLNPENKFNIKTMAPDNLILIDTMYHKIKFEYDLYACHRFQTILQNEIFKHKSLFDLEEIMLDNINTLKENAQQNKLN